MKKYKFIQGLELGSEVSMLPANRYFVDDTWFKVYRVFDRCVGKVALIVKQIYYDIPSVNHFDMVQYIKDKHGNKKGVMVAFDGKVGWSMVHPKDMKDCIINWDFAKALAAKKAVKVSEFFKKSYPHIFDSPWLDIPYTLRTLQDGFYPFISRYNKYLENGIKKEVEELNKQGGDSWLKEKKLRDEESKKKTEGQKIQFSPCKFCGNDKQDSFNIETSGIAPLSMYAVVCPCCGGHGPLGRTEEESVDFWNFTPNK